MPALRAFTCTQCGQDFSQNGPGRPRKICDSCKRDAQSDRTPPGCEICGQPATVGKRGPVGRFCSRDCRLKSYPTRTREYKPRCTGCPNCGEPRETKHARTCGAQVCREALLGPERLCSRPACNRPHSALGLCMSHYAMERNHMRRAALAGRPRESFTHLEIFERDGWVCRLCGDPVNKELAHPDPMSASLDHILPVANGGAHTRENVQLAHWLCNVSKSNRV
jgi:hypothetical protein